MYHNISHLMSDSATKGNTLTPENVTEVVKDSRISVEQKLVLLRSQLDCHEKTRWEYVQLKWAVIFLEKQLCAKKKDESTDNEDFEIELFDGSDVGLVDISIENEYVVTSEGKFIVRPDSWLHEVIYRHSKDDVSSPLFKASVDTTRTA